jgi:DNA-binding NarL/FixJ family response regulator
VGRTVVIVDDHETFRESARELLEAAGYSVVGEAADGPAALVAVECLSPDVVLLDIQLPGLDGFAVAERLATNARSPAVVLISSRDAVTYGERVRRASVVGFLSKRELSGAALAGLLEE